MKNNIVMKYNIILHALEKEILSFLYYCQVI